MERRRRTATIGKKNFFRATREIREESAKDRKGKGQEGKRAKGYGVLETTTTRNPKE